MTSAPPLFSVVIAPPTRGSRLMEAVRSISATSPSEVEVVVALETADDLPSEEDLRSNSPYPLRVVTPRSDDRWEALNAAAGAASGEWLAFLLPNEAFHADRLEVFGRVAMTNPFEWGFSGVAAIDGSGRELAEGYIPSELFREALRQTRSPLAAIRALPWANTILAPGNLVVRRSQFQSLGGFRPFRTFEGWDLALRLLEVAPPYAIDRPLYYVRVDRASIRNAAADSDRRREAEVVISARRQRLAARSCIRQPQPTDDLAPGERAAVRAVLAMVAAIRRVPAAYSLVRLLYRAYRRVRGA